MNDRCLRDVRRKFVAQMRANPPPIRSLGPSGALDGRLLDRWVAERVSPEELAAICRLEREYGEAALAEWFAEIALEAGLGSATRH